MKRLFTLMLTIVITGTIINGKEKGGKNLAPKSIQVSKADSGTTLNITLPKSRVIDENAIRTLTVKIKDGVLKGVDSVTGDPASAWDVGPWTMNVSTSVTYEGVQRSSQEAKQYFPKFGGMAGPLPANTAGGRINATVFPQDWRWDVQGNYKIDESIVDELASVKMPFSKRISKNDIKKKIDGVCLGIRLNDDKVQEKINELTRILQGLVREGVNDRERQIAFQLTIAGFRQQLISQLNGAQNLFEESKSNIAGKIKNNIDDASPAVKITNIYSYRNDQRDPADPDLGWNKTNNIQTFGVKGFDLNGRFGFKSPIKTIKVMLKGDIWVVSGEATADIDIDMSFFIKLGLKGDISIYHDTAPSPRTSPSALVSASPKVDITGTAGVDSKQSVLEAEINATVKFAYDVGALEGTIIAGQHREEHE